MEDVQMTAAGSTADDTGSSLFPSKIHSSTFRPSTIDMSLDDAISSSRPAGRQPGRGRRDDRGGPRFHDQARHHQRTVRREYRQGEDRQARGSIRKPWDLPSGSDRRISVSNDGGIRLALRNDPGQIQSKLTVSNLHHDVTPQDLHELFGKVGRVRKVFMFYDRAGRSEGRAEVSFEGRLEAQMAQDTFQNVPLDGMPMRIELTPLHSSNSRTFAGGNPRQDYGRDRTPQGRWTHDRVPADDRLKTSGRPMSMDVLDDDLDSYMMGRHA